MDTPERSKAKAGPARWKGRKPDKTADYEVEDATGTNAKQRCVHCSDYWAFVCAQHSFSQRRELGKNIVVLATQVALHDDHKGALLDV